MKALFAHDHQFIPAEGVVWSETQFEAALWKRYLAHFEALTVVGRVGTMPSANSAACLERSSAPDVTFDLFPNLSNLRSLALGRAKARRRMHALVAAHDAVIARLPSEIGLLAIAAARAQGKPSALEVVACPWDAYWNYGTFMGRLYAPAAWARMYQALGCADHAIYVTREFLQRRYPTGASNTAGVSNVILAEVSSTVLETRLARISVPPVGPLRVGLVGTLRNRNKGIHTVFQALARSRTDLPPLRFHILGGGNPGPWLAEAAQLGVSDLVSFDGILPPGEPVLRWLDSVDVYLQPSLQEGLPRALIEAMSRGCPSLASTVAGIPELLPAEDLIHPGDAQALADLLRRRLTDREWMASRARANWEVARGYRAEVLEARRATFWGHFRKAVEAQQQTGPLTSTRDVSKGLLSRTVSRRNQGAASASRNRRMAANDKD